MLAPRKIQEEVQKRLAALRHVDEDVIHHTYLAVMFEATEGARQAVNSIRLHATERRMHHPTQGWIMVTREQQEKFEELCKRLEQEMRVDVGW